MDDEPMRNTGYPSIDKPWMKYYSEEAINSKLPEESLYGFLYKNNREYKNDIALNYFDHKITYGELFQNIEKTAKSFYALGVREGESVVVCSINIPETIYTIYALNRLGVVVNMIDPRSSNEAVKHYISECQAKYIVVLDTFYKVVKNAIDTMSIEKMVIMSASVSLPLVKRLLYEMKDIKIQLDNKDIMWNDFIKKGKTIEPFYPEYKKNKCAILAHTGGTTGIPKTVMLSADNLNAVAYAYKYLGIPFERQQKYFNDLPPFIIYGLTLGVHISLCYGQQVIVYPIFDSKTFPKQFIKYKPNHFSALSGHLKCLCENSRIQQKDLSFLISAGVGGDTLNEELEKRVNRFLNERKCKYEVCKGYGMSELSATAVISFLGANAIGSVGVPLIINLIKVVDTETGKEKKYNEVGEIWISGPSIMLGYKEKLDEKNEIILVDKEGRRWLRTGDLGYINNDGLLFLQGRLRRIYLSVVDGQPSKIYPDLIEKNINKYSKVSECCAVGRLRKNSTYYEIIVYIVKNDDTENEILKSELIEYAKDVIPSKMQPKEYRFIERLPRTLIGKIDYRKLEEMAKG